MSVSQRLGNVPLEPPAVPGAESPEAAEVPGVRGWNLESDDRGGGGGWNDIAENRRNDGGQFEGQFSTGNSEG